MFCHTDRGRTAARRLEEGASSMNDQPVWRIIESRAAWVVRRLIRLIEANTSWTDRETIYLEGLNHG